MNERLKIKGRQPIARRLSDVGEFGVISLIERLTPATGPDVIVGIGDDTAVLRPSPGKALLATCDIQLEGRHFRRDWLSARDLGRRAAAVNLSDIAAMGGQPRFALVSLGLPPRLETQWVKELYRGLDEAFNPYRISIVGGNLTSSERIIVDLTLLGEMDEALVLRRSTARAGDSILVTGALGKGAAGLLALQHGMAARGRVSEAIAAFRTPQARVREGQAIAATGKATAMIDVSDGLASDLRHICRASGLSALVRAAQVPIASFANVVAERAGVMPLDLALGGGDDYELLFTVPPKHAASVVAAVDEATGIPVTVIGEMRPGPFAMWLEHEDGRRTRLDPEGWDHFKAHQGGA